MVSLVGLGRTHRLLEFYEEHSVLLFKSMLENVQDVLQIARDLVSLLHKALTRQAGIEANRVQLCLQLLTHRMPIGSGILCLKLQSSVDLLEMWWLQGWATSNCR